MNNRQIKDKIKNIVNDKNLDFNTVLRLFMYERFIERLSVSDYRDNFILKGGFYLSTLFGLENRSTADIDTAFINSDFNIDNLSKIIYDIINIDINDNAQIILKDISNIRQEDEYGGFRFTLTIILDGMRETFHIDIATGDPITPSAIRYKYNSILNDKSYNLWAYNIETVLAEKFHSILSKGENTSRLRDFYDIHLIYTKEFDNINFKHLKSAIKNTFDRRELVFKVEKFNILIHNDALNRRWKQYSKKYDYASEVLYDDIIKKLGYMLEKVGLIKCNILSNKARCLKCDDIIESVSVHDFKYCKCKTIAVDGGRDYLRRVGDINNFEDLSEFEYVEVTK